MAGDDLVSVARAKKHIRTVIRSLRSSNSGYVDMLQQLVDGMDGWYDTKENLHKVGVICYPRALGDQCVAGYSFIEWNDEVQSLRDDCASAFNELEQGDPSASQ